MKILIISIPLISGLSILALGRYLGKKGAILVSTLGILISVIISIKILIDYLKYNTITLLNLGKWFDIGTIETSLEFIFDKESIIMINLISMISFIVISYSIWYMNNDAHISRFLSKLLIFTVTMYILVTSNNFILLFAGWETVGIMSYLLINFWFNSLNSNKSAFKAILYNKVGDIGYIIGLTILINIYNNSNIKNIAFSTLTTLPPTKGWGGDSEYITNVELGNNYQSLVNLLLFFFILAAIAKSAQIFLHCWLGDAMAGPTPVSALLHAATMVTAGVFLLIRFSSTYLLEVSSFAQSLIVVVGALTILFGGFSSIGQYDIKKLIAFSTCSQIGYMFINNGFNNKNISLLFNSTGLADSSLFHLLTHGFFKALLFLSAGILIHNLNNDQDIRKYGSLIFKFPLTYIFFLIGSLSIISFPFLSGFYSKENIINNSFIYFNNYYIGIFLIFGAFLTNLYSFKLLFTSFFKINNSPKFLLFNYLHPPAQPLVGDNQRVGEEIPFIYYPIFIILLIGSTFLGFFGVEFFIAPGLTPYGIDHELFPGYQVIKPIPLFIIFFVIFLNIKYNLNIFFLPYKWASFFYLYFITFFNRRGFFDPIFNYLLAYPTLISSYNFFKFLDRGFLEFFGPLGLFRFFYYFSSEGNFSLKNQNISNINYLFIYFFLSVFTLIFGFTFLF